MPFALRPILQTLTLALCLLATTCITAQEAAKPEDKPKSAALPEPVAYTTPPDVQARLRKLFPNAYDKLRQRQSIHILAIGDEVFRSKANGGDSDDPLVVWPAQFAKELAGEFSYSGGVTLLPPNRKPAKHIGPIAPEITLRIATVEGGVLRKALSVATAYGASPVPDIILIAASWHDVERGGDLMNAAKSLHTLIEALNSKADLVLAGPMLNCVEPIAANLASTCALAGIMRDAATEAGIGFADLGDLTRITRFNDLKLTPEASFEYVTQQQRNHFLQPSGERDWQHPSPAFHQRLGATAYQQLASAPLATPWQLSAVSTAEVEDTKATIHGELVNTTSDPLVLAVQSLAPSGWQPDDKPAILTLKPNEKLPLTLHYSRVNGAENLAIHPLPAHEPLLRVPLFISSAKTVRIEELRASIKPVALLWKLDTLFNQSNTFTLDNLLLNTSDKDLNNVSWTAEWAGQKKTGKTDLAAGKGSTLPLTFDLPKEAGARRTASPIVLSITAPGIRMQWLRAIEARQNIGINQDVPLTTTGDTKGIAQLRVEAQEKTASFIFDLADQPLRNDDSKHALKAELHLDARSYGKRLEAGSTEAIVAQVGAEDGEGSIGPIAPWAFGTGYAMRFNEHGVSAKLSTDRSGHRIFTITLPKSYLYLHEWAIGNGNSQIGLSAKLSTPTNQSFELSLNGRDRDDAESSTVLELTPKPTSRWTVIVW